jgi:hypothetical protein
MIGSPVFTRGMSEVILPDSAYRGFTAQQEASLKDWVKTLNKSNRKTLNLLTKAHGSVAALRLPADVRQQSESYWNERSEKYQNNLTAAKHTLWKVMSDAKKMQKTGVTTSIGYNFYDLRGPVELLFPFHTPFRNLTPREPRVNEGVGTAAHWQRITSPGYSYPGVPEAQRAQITTPNMVPAIATYKEFGKENQVTYTSEFAGEGFNDNLATERLDALLALFLAEEGQILNGNSGNGTGSNGFVLGTPAAPVAAVSAATGSTIPNTTKVTVYVVALTAMANPVNPQYGYYNAPLTVGGGLTPNFTYNAPGTNQAITINGGTSILSAASNSYTTTVINQAVSATISPIKGAMGGYAWFVSTNGAPTTANAYLYAITPYSNVTILAVPAGTTQTAAAFVTAGGGVDYSGNPYDLDGLFAWAAQYGQWVDLAGASLTSLKNGKVLEIENMLQTLFTLFQTGVDELWGDLVAVECLDQAVRWGGTSATGFQFIANRDGQGNLMGGFLVSGYLSRYAVANPTGANVLPIRIHPMIPTGTLLFNIRTVPVGYSHSRLPYIYGMLVQRDYYGMEWPPLFRAWNFGSYVHEVLAHKFPGLIGVITGIGPFVQN